MTRLSTRSLETPPSPIRRIFSAARTLQDQGKDVIRLDIGDPDFDMPPRIGRAIEDALRRGETHYSAAAGLAPLRAAIAQHMRRRHGIECLASEVIVNQGATQGLLAALLSTCDPGDSILLPEFCFPIYYQQCVLARVRPRPYALDANFQTSLEMVQAAADDSVRALLINSPSNPTGAVLRNDVIRDLFGWARSGGIWVLSDEAYVDYVFEGEAESLLQMDRRSPKEERNVLGLYSFSKSYAVTGLRMGWTVAPSERVSGCLGIVNEPLTGSLTTPLQWGMIAALESDDTPQRRKQLMGRRELVNGLLKDFAVDLPPPKGGMFVFLDISRCGMAADDFALRLLKDEEVAVVPGSGFGLRFDPRSGTAMTPTDRASRYVRICFAVPEERLRQGLQRLGRFIQRHSSARPGLDSKTA